jgi:hypothetical protein
MNDQSDILISRIVESDADSRDFEQFIASAEQSPELWRHLVQSLRDRIELERLVSAAGERADHVRTNANVDARSSDLRLHDRGPAARPLAIIRGWGGWAVAAAVMLALVLEMQPGRTTSDSTSQGGPEIHEAGIASSVSAREAFEQYMQRGREEGLVISQTPQRVLLDTRPVASGDGYELIYIQQVVERTVVPELYHYGGQDEHGRPTLVNYDHARRPAM